MAAIDALLSRVYGVHTCELGGDFDYLGAFNAGESVSATAAAALNHDGRVFLTIN
ncbi:MAG: hypothetical protein JOY78_20285 [Pseudonocardia sp.]|nr:hypothetical protein [Pseudonocardia sp.]